MLLPETGADLTDEAIVAAYAWPQDAWPQDAGTPVAADGAWLRCNMVSSVDGAARGPDGLSGPLNNAADMRVFGLLRGRADAILVGAQTVRAEGYRSARPKAAFADARRTAGQRPAPVMALVSRSLDLDTGAAMFADPAERPIVLTTQSADPGRRAALERVADVVMCGDTSVDPGLARAALVARGLTRIHSEGGPTLLAGLAAAGQLDELCLTVTPVLAGGAYPDLADVSRILNGVPLPDPPRALRIGHLLEDDGTLFLRYRVTA